MMDSSSELRRSQFGPAALPHRWTQSVFQPLSTPSLPRVEHRSPETVADASLVKAQETVREVLEAEDDEVLLYELEGLVNEQTFKLLSTVAFERHERSRVEFLSMLSAAWSDRFITETVREGLYFHELLVEAVRKQSEIMAQMVRDGELEPADSAEVNERPRRRAYFPELSQATFQKNLSSVCLALLAIRATDKQRNSWREKQLAEIFKQSSADATQFFASWHLDEGFGDFVLRELDRPRLDLPGLIERSYTAGDAIVERTEKVRRGQSVSLTESVDSEPPS